MKLRILEPLERLRRPKLLTNPLPPPQNDSETNRSEEEAGESEAQEIPPVADSEATLLPNGEIILNRDLEPANDNDSTETGLETNPEPPANATETKFGEIDSFYSLRVELPFEGYCELEEIVRKYRRAGAARVLQSSYSDLDAMSLEA